MKKIIVLFLALVTVGAFALPVDMSGQFTYGFTTDGEKVQVSYADAYSYFTVKPSDLTKFILKLTYFTNSQPAAVVGSGGRGVDANFAKVYAEEAYVAQNMGVMFGIDPKVAEVWVDFGVKNNLIISWPPTDFSMENVSIYDPGAMDTVGVRAVFAKILTVNAWFNPHGQGKYDVELNPMRFGTQIIVDVAPAKVTGWYTTAGQKTADKGIIGGEVMVNQAIGPVTVIADIEVKNDMALTTDDAQSFGAALQAAYGIYQASLSTFGNKAGPLEMGVDTTITPVKPFSIICGAAFNLRPNAVKFFDGAEIGGSLKFDKAKFRFGYLLTETGMNGVSMYCPNPLLKGGMFAKIVMGY